MSGDHATDELPSGLDGGDDVLVEPEQQVDVDATVTKLTGKNQVTIPARIVAMAGMEPGTRLQWIPTDRDHVIEVRVLPNIARVASGLRGRGAKYSKRAGSAVERLMRERRRQHREADHR